MLRRNVLMFLGMAALLVTPAANGQSTFGTILGAVRDPAGAAIPGAKITVVNEGTNIGKDVTSNDIGNYEVTHLNPGLYRVAAEVKGFQKYVNAHVNLVTGQILRIDIAIKMSDIAETVTVTGRAPVIETETGTISDLRTGQQMRDLPINYLRSDGFSGGIYKIVGLTPGAMRFEGTGSSSFAGSRSSQNNWIADGTSLGDQGGNDISSAQPSLETIREVNVTMVNNSAQYGGVATVTVTSKSGTNELHGSGFEQYTTGRLIARNFFQNSVPFRVYNGFGGGLGGPVVLPGYNGRNRTFFFGAFEGSRNHNRAIFNSSVPTAAVRQGDFSQVFSGGKLIVVKDPTTSQPFAGNRIPSARFSSPSSKIQERYYPLPNFGAADLLSQNLRDTQARTPYWNQFDIRLDHQVNDKNSLYGRFSWRNLPVPFCYPCQLPTIPVADQLRRVRSLSLVDTHVISPTLVNEMRAGFAWHENRFTDSVKGLPILQDLGLQGINIGPDIPGTPYINVTGFSSFSTWGTGRQQDMVYDFVETLTFMTGRHSVKTGFNFKKNQASRYYIYEAFGGYDFTGAFTGFAWADFLLGVPQTTRRAMPPSRTYGRNQSYAAYVQDDFKVSPSLTLNLGLRYERMNPFADKYDRMFNFDTRTGNLVVPTQTVLQRDVVPVYPKSIKIVTAAEAGFPQRGLRTADSNNFDPRFGLAWRPFRNASSVVRGGFGVYHNVLSSSTFDSLSGGNGGGPFSASESFTNNILNGVPLFQFPQPFLAVGTVGTQSVTGVMPHIFNPYTLQWNLTLEQQFRSLGFRASYIGTRSVNLLYRKNFNQPVPSAEPYNPSRLVYPQYGTIVFTDNGGNSMYHAFQLEAQRKLGRSLTFQVGWTWAKQLSNGVDGGEQGAVIQNAYDRKADWGDDLYLHRHRFVSTFMWELPFGPGKPLLRNLHGALGQILGGWVIGGDTILQTGQRFTPTYSGRDASNTNNTGGRPDRIGNGNLPASERTVARWFDASAFVVPPVNAGRFGNAGIGILEGPGTINVDVGLYKNVRLRENARLQFTVSATNALNHPNFRNPATNISAPLAVGRMSAIQDQGGPRVVLLSARVDF